MIKQTTWISVKDRLPENHVNVLFLYSDDKGTEYITGWYDEENEEWVSLMVSFFRNIREKSCEDCHFNKKNVHFWMPLPHPPHKS